MQSTPCARRTKARSALADFLRLVPDATVASTRAQVPLKGAGDLDRYVAALKRAGLRDSRSTSCAEIRWAGSKAPHHVFALKIVARRAQVRIWHSGHYVSARIVDGR